jgi:hypothetical protein
LQTGVVLLKALRLLLAPFGGLSRATTIFNATAQRSELVSLYNAVL